MKWKLWWVLNNLNGITLPSFIVLCTKMDWMGIHVLSFCLSTFRALSFRMVLLLPLLIWIWICMSISALVATLSVRLNWMRICRKNEKQARLILYKYERVDPINSFIWTNRGFSFHIFYVFSIWMYMADLLSTWYYVRPLSLQFKI